MSLGNYSQRLGNQTGDQYDETTVVVKEFEGSGSTDTTTKPTFEGIVSISTKYIFVMVKKMMSCLLLIQIYSMFRNIMGRPTFKSME